MIAPTLDLPIRVSNRTIYALGDEPLALVCDGLMKCPTCGEHTADRWSRLQTDTPVIGLTGILEGPEADSQAVAVEWMRCANAACGELLIRVIEGYGSKMGISTATRAYVVRPRHHVRIFDPLVVGQYRQDFEEAAAILDLSPRMSAVLSRRILADLLEEYAQLDDFRLVDRIDKFVADSSHPTDLRQNLHYLREIADLSAHTKKNDQAEIVTADRDEAEWTLGIIERLFDYFIVGPERDRAFRAGVDKKLAETGRKPIEPLTD